MRLISWTHCHELRWDKPMARAALEIEPCARIASSNAIFAGPNLLPSAGTMRMERRELVIVTNTLLPARKY
jgi:hypothetical protein